MHQKIEWKGRYDSNTTHDYIDTPGSHNWDYWQMPSNYQLVYFECFL